MRIYGDPEAAAVPVAAQPGVASSDGGWLTDVELAKSLAKRAGKPMLIDFTAAWCAACGEMQRKTYDDPRFKTEARRFVRLRIDGTDEDSPAFARETVVYAIKGLPAVVLVDGAGAVAKVFRRKPELDELCAAMAAVE